MNFSVSKLLSAIWTRNKEGENFYFVDQENNWGLNGSNLKIAQDHPILTPGLLFVSKIFSQAKFNVRNTTTGKDVNTHWVLELLRNPNIYQTQQDFLETLMFSQIAEGLCIVYARKITGFDDASSTKSYHILLTSLIKWPEEFKTPIKITEEAFNNKSITYDEEGENIKIKLRDLMFFYDLPNGLQKNKLKVKSRLDGLKQTLVNTSDSLLAKNIILKTNGKELITGVKDGIQLNTEEKEAAENLFNSNYGMGIGRKRSLITKAQMTHKSLHIAVRDLGLDESVKVDGNIVYTALHIPKDIISLEAKKTTYNNFKESMVSYIQNEQQSSLDAFCAVINKNIEPGLELYGSYEHLPIMQFILIERYDGVKKRAEALTALRSSGLPDDIALELTGFDKNTKLEDLKQTQNGNETEQQAQTDEGTEGSSNNEQE